MRTICLACRRPEKGCLCASIRPFSVDVPFIILIHPKEARRASTGTARLARLCLENSEMLAGVDFTEDERVNRWIADPGYEPVVLFPGKSPIELGGNHLSGLEASGRKLCVFVIDGTWITARKIMKLSRNLNRLPRISLAPERPSRFAIRQQPHKLCLSTIEAVHDCIDLLDRTGYLQSGGRQGNLLEVFDRMVSIQREYMEDTTLPGYRKRGAVRTSERRVLSPKNERRIPFPD